MNVRRLATCGLVVAALVLLAAASPAAAGGPFFTEFTGSGSNCTETGMVAPTVVRGGKLHVRALMHVCTDTATDPRVTGTEADVIYGVLDLVDNMSGPFWGTNVLTGPDGQWLGVWTGERTSEGSLYIRAVLHLDMVDNSVIRLGRPKSGFVVNIGTDVGRTQPGLAFHLP